MNSSLIQFFSLDSGTLYQVLQKYYDLKTVKRDLVESLMDNLTDNQAKTTLEKLLNNTVGTFISSYLFLSYCIFVKENSGVLDTVT